MNPVRRHRPSSAASVLVVLIACLALLPLHARAKPIPAEADIRAMLDNLRIALQGMGGLMNPDRR